jgi:hypothetical protein
MTMNRIQFQRGLSLAGLVEQYGTEVHAPARCVERVGRRASSARVVRNAAIAVAPTDTATDSGNVRRAGIRPA